MKLRLRGYILRRCDTNEYLAELILYEESAIVGWTISEIEANLSKSKLDAMRVGFRLGDILGVVVQLYQFFEFDDDCLSLYLAEYDPKLLVSESCFEEL